MNSYEKALKKIAEDSKCKPQCMGAIIGPTGPTGPAGIGITGPTGPQGPATITVGATTTGTPGGEASVTNTGDNENVVLTFDIPQGPTGPQGEVGATGPTGPANGLNAYGGLYHEDNGTVTLTNTTPSPVGIDTEMPEENLTYNTGENTITIVENGTYDITYSALISSDTQTDVTLSVRSAGANIPGTGITKSLQQSQVTPYNGNTIATLDAGDVLTLSLVGGQSANITLSGTGVNAYLIVKKLD